MNPADHYPPSRLPSLPKPVLHQAGTRWRLNAASGLHKGDRPYQQDQLRVVPHPRVPGCVLAVIADGMGGKSGGRKAADQVMLTAVQLFERYHPDTDDAHALLKQIVEESHSMIRLTALSTEQEPHSTIACALFHADEGRCYWTHVGDSRIYIFRDGRLLQRTKDHSYVQTLVDKGELTEAKARNHPMSNVLTCSLGMSELPPGTVKESELMPDDTLMLCSDGVWHYFTDQELETATAKLEARECCQFLIDKARTRAGGRGDNLSIIVIDLVRLPAPAGTPPAPR